MTSMSPAVPANCDSSRPADGIHPASLGNIALAEKAVPRYTSYPTAPHFTPAVTADTYRAWLGELSPCTSLSLYLHVPFCAAMCAYCGCHTKVTRRSEPVTAYRDHLLAEIDLVARLTPARQVRHLHWGGGTPSMLGEAGLTAIAERLAQRFRIGPGAEHAIELDPRQLDRGLAAALKRVGVTRASLGVQDLNPHVQEAIGRIQPLAVVAAAVEALHAAGIDALSFDLMYGLPHQSMADLMRTIDLATAMRPSRISLFGYAHVPWFKTHQRLIDEQALPDAVERFRQQTAAREALQARGYEAVGLDHFARPDDAMAVAARDQRLKRNFQGYTTDDAEALIGFGASAIGRLPRGFVQNAPDIGGYQRAVAAGAPATVRGLALSLEDRVRADAIERLMCDFSADLEAVARRHGVAGDFFDSDLAGLVPLESQGLVSCSDRTVVVSEAGRPLVRVVASLFDAHLAKAGRHSSAV
jgi:oxygen-independent coproporphyrinogen-3 oxidase